MGVVIATPLTGKFGGGIADRLTAVPISLFARAMTPLSLSEAQDEGGTDPMRGGRREVGRGARHEWEQTQ